MMEFGSWVSVAVAVMLLIAVGFASALRFASVVTPARGKDDPRRSTGPVHRARMPVFLPFIAWTIAGIALWALYSSIVHHGGGEGAATRLGAVALLAFSSFILWIHFNWFVEIRPDHVRFRSYGRRIKTILYKDIVRYRIEDGNNHRSLTVWDRDGTVLNLNITMFDAGLLLDHVLRMADEERSQKAREEERRGAWGLQVRNPLEQSQSSGEPSQPSEKPVLLKGGTSPERNEHGPAARSAFSPGKATAGNGDEFSSAPTNRGTAMPREPGKETDESTPGPSHRA